MVTGGVGVSLPVIKLACIHGFSSAEDPLMLCTLRVVMSLWTARLVIVTLLRNMDVNVYVYVHVNALKHDMRIVMQAM